MKKGEHKKKNLVHQIIIFAIILFIVTGGIGCIITESTFTIKIKSDTRWSGSIGSVEEGQWSVEGSGNETFTVHGTIASACIQKSTSFGYLQVSIYKDGKLVARQETTASYGVVAVSG
ncbi:MAG: hypothetical protein J7K59_03080 [Candidatus Korarchaeota archaeon]|nr:hypothetical protein [Candidatus Korarchaeota archaeon]